MKSLSPNDLLSEALLKLGILESAKFSPSQRPELCDLQSNIAMIIAKKYQKSPEQIALPIVDILKQSPTFSNVDFVKPGFINVSLSDDYLVSCLNEQMVLPLSSNGKTIMIDMGGANIAKAMHVGHLRSLVIGDSIGRILKEVGYTVIKDTHLGDWGLQIGMLISEIKIRYPNLGYWNNLPSEFMISLEELEELYPLASQACQISVERKLLAQQTTVELQHGHVGYHALWQDFRHKSVEDLKKTLDFLKVDFDLFEGESSVNHLLSDMLADLESKQITTLDQGAIVAWLDEKTPVILQKSDGGALYATTDLACILDRLKRFLLDKIIYIVDQRQSQHMQSVFKLAGIAGYQQGVELIHAGFGTVNGPDGKPFKTRDGGTMKLKDLLEISFNSAYQRLPEDIKNSNGEQVGWQIALAGLKFSDLSGHRLSDYTFDLEKALSLEGKTGPYLQYACVRIQSLLEKSKVKTCGSLIITHPLERNLILACTRYQEVLELSSSELTPHVLAEYSFNLARSFYKECPVLNAKEDIKSSRLQLCQNVFNILSRCLYLLGIEVPHKM